VDYEDGRKAKLEVLPRLEERFWASAHVTDLRVRRSDIDRKDLCMF
jgi:hypothetical protein